ASSTMELFAGGTAGSGPGEFHLIGVGGIDIDHLGNVYVADTGNNRIQMFDSDGNSVKEIGAGMLTGNSFSDVGVDSLGFLYTVNKAFDYQLYKFMLSRYPPYRAEPAVDVKIPLLKEGDILLLVKDGEPAASIIIARDASLKVVKHARFLQKTIEQMTGVRLPVRDDSRDWEGAQILVGPSKLNDVTVPQGFDQPEAYRVVVEGRKVSLVGNDAGPYQGTGYAVYDLLWELGCGWFGPDPLYQVIPET
ncbi:unnamed protein product, partial [marine sediment metagenome]